MTLDDLELMQGQILSEFRLILRFCKATTAKRMKIDLASNKGGVGKTSYFRAASLSWTR